MSGIGELERRRNKLFKYFADLYLFGTKPKTIIYDDGSLKLECEWIHPEAKEAYDKGKEVLKMLNRQIYEYYYKEEI